MVGDDVGVVQQAHAHLLLERSQLRHGRGVVRDHHRLLDAMVVDVLHPVDQIDNLLSFGHAYLAISPGNGGEHVHAQLVFLGIHPCFLPVVEKGILTDTTKACSQIGAADGLRGPPL
jgi:hypothetical protein